MSLKQQAAEDAARILRATWGSSASLPIDPVRIARRLGIDVLNARLDRDVSGALVKERGQDPVILLNSIDSANRQRFTCAHEIGHFVQRSDQPDAYEYVDRRDMYSSAGTDQDEIYANTFAACLLMPEDQLRRFHREGLGEIELALRFDVSREAVHNRLAVRG